MAYLLSDKMTVNIGQFIGHFNCVIFINFKGTTFRRGISGISVEGYPGKKPGHGLTDVSGFFEAITDDCFLLRHRRCGSDFLIHNSCILAFLGTKKRHAFPVANPTRRVPELLRHRAGVHAVCVYHVLSDRHKKSATRI